MLCSTPRPCPSPLLPALTPPAFPVPASLLLQMPRPRAAPCQCPTQPLPSACHRCRSQKVGAQTAGCSVQVAQQCLAWLAGWFCLHGRCFSCGGGCVLSKAGCLILSPQSTHATSCPAEHPTTAPASAPEMQPGTPVGSASSSRGQRGDSSSSEEGAPANSVQHDEVLPLLAGESGSGRLAPGLRRRQGHQECG